MTATAVVSVATDAMPCAIAGETVAGNGGVAAVRGAGGNVGKGVGVVSGNSVGSGPVVGTASAVAVTSAGISPPHAVNATTANITTPTTEAKRPIG